MVYKYILRKECCQCGTINEYSSWKCRECGVYLTELVDLPLGHRSVKVKR